MEVNTKNNFSRGERLVLGATVPIGNFLYKTNKKRKYMTVEEIFSKAGICIDDISPEVKSVLNHKVSQICRAGSRFTTDSICVQLYEDGSNVLRWAMKHGAVLCVSREQIDNYPCIVTDNPAAIYADLCSAVMQHMPFSIAVAGSIGKTTAKKMIYSVFREEVKTFCDSGNDNQLDGVGYFAQHIPEKSKVWIQEVSEDTPGSVSEISKIVRPDVAVITAIDKSHIEAFGSESGIVKEICSVSNYMSKSGVCIINIDDENTANLSLNTNTKTVSLFNKNADFYAKDVSVQPKGLSFVIVDNHKNTECKIHLAYVFAKHNIYSALYAFACGVTYGLKYENIVKGIQAYKASGVRQNIYSDRGVTIYADCYNAVAKSVRSAIVAADSIPVKGNKIAVIGDIAETGSYTESTHSELIDIINESKFDVLLAYGINTCKAAKRMTHRADLEVICCSSRKELNRAIKNKVRRGDLVLFKASHSTGLEKSLRKCFPLSYMTETVDYLWPQVTWRFKVLFN